MTPSITVARTTVTLRAGALLLSQAVGDPIPVRSCTVFAYWAPGGTVELELHGLWSPYLGRTETFHARRRTVSDLEATNPGLLAALRAAAPHAPWPA